MAKAFFEGTYFTQGRLGEHFEFELDIPKNENPLAFLKAQLRDETSKTFHEFKEKYPKFEKIHTHAVKEKHV